MRFYSLISIGIAAFLFFASFTPAYAQVGCADGTVEQTFSPLPDGSPVQGCNGAVPFSNAGLVCASGWRVGDVVNDSGLRGVLESQVSNGAHRWIRMNGDPGDALGQGGPGSAQCWGTLSPCASSRPAGNNIRPVHQQNFSLYYNGILVLAGTGQVHSGTSGAICIGPPPTPTPTPTIGPTTTSTPPTPTLAATATPPPTSVPIISFWGEAQCVVDGVATINCIPAVIKLIIQSLLLFAGIVAVFLMVQSGAKFVLSSGDPKKVEEARNGLVYAVLGLIIVMAAFLIVSLVSHLTGVKCFEFIGFICL